MEFEIERTKDRCSWKERWEITGKDRMETFSGVAREVGKIINSPLNFLSPCIDKFSTNQMLR